jgi:hypothetical protein
MENYVRNFQPKSEPIGNNTNNKTTYCILNIQIWMILEVDQR